MADNLNEENNVAENFLNVIFNEMVVTIIIWFITAYMLISAGLGLFKSDDTSMIVKIVDFVVLLAVLFYFVMQYYSLSKEQRNEFVTVFLDEVKAFLNEPANVLYSGVFVGAIYLVAYLLQMPMDPSKMTYFI